MSNFTTMAGWVRLIWNTLTDMGLDAEQLFDQAELDVKTLANPHARFPVQNIQRLWDLCVCTTKNPSIGLEVGKRVSPTSFDALGYSALASEHADAAIEKLVQYGFILSDGVSFDYTKMKGYGRVVLHTRSNDYSYAGVEALFSAIKQLCRAFLFWQDAFSEIHFCHPCFGNKKDYELYFQCPVHFSQPQNCLIGSGKQTPFQFTTANASLAYTNEQVLKKLVHHGHLETLTQKVNLLVDELMNDEIPTAHQIAQKLFLSERTLQLHLQKEGTKFREILEQVRMEKAKVQLHECKSVSEVAWRLGFKEVSSFTRAFKRYAGCTPSQWLSNSQSISNPQSDSNLQSISNS